MNADDSDSDYGSNKLLSVKGDTTPSLATPPLNTAHPMLRRRRNSSVINEQDGRDTEEGALNEDDNNIDDDSHDECGAVLNRGGLISRILSSSRLLAAQRSLPKDTFSFIIISSLFSLPFLIAIIVFSFQVSIFSLVSVDVIDLSNSRNPFHLPPNVESTVRATQVLAIIIAIVTQDDVKKVILILRDGYTADVFQETFGPDATKFKWILSLVLRAAEGLLGLLVTFMLIMQSQTVLDLLLNFSAMEFVSLLDDGAFSMLHAGYFGIGMMKHATLCEKKYHVSRLKSSCLAAVYFIIIFAVMFSGWIGVYTNQATGEYLCQRMYIQLEDEFAPALVGLSGIYTVNHNERFGGRVTSSQETGKGKIGYCDDKNVWTLSIQDPLVPYDPCLGWTAKSSQSFDFDILKTTSSQWYAHASTATQGSRYAYIVDVELICASCDYDTNECLNGGICRTDGICDCRNNATGDWCQVEPTYNGHCDTYYNKHEFNYDGGDCCESTCVSTDLYTCGKDESGLVDMGYPQCNSKTDPYNEWFQSGNSVNGVVTAVAGLKNSVALGGRGGTVLAVGDPGAAIVRLFDKDGSKWVQRGEALKGPAVDSLFGMFISLSSGESENVMMNDYSSPTVMLAVDGMVDNFSFVRVYGCRNSGCEQIGSDIILSSPLFSVSLSRDGNRFAIGTWLSSANFVNRVKVGIYELDQELQPPDWKMIGNITDYSLPVNQSDLSAETFTYFHLVKLSGNGQVLITGTQVMPVELSYNTHKWNSTIGSWGVMDDKGGLLSKTRENGIACMAVSDDGTVIAVCSDPGIEVYSWNADKSSWIPRDVVFDLNNFSTSLTVSSVDISGDGSTLAIESNIGIWALKWNGTHYKQYLNSIPSVESSAISLSRDGNAMAVGHPDSGNNGGVTTVYKVRPRCTDNKKLLRISFSTDDNPAESRWTLQIGNETIQRKYDFLQPGMTFVEEICVPNDVCVKFRVFDTYGDGMLGYEVPGGYSVMLDGVEVANGGADLGYVATKYITGDCTVCPAGLSLLSIVAQNRPDSYIPMEWALSHQNSTSAEEYVFIRTMDHEVEIFEECIPDGCWHLTNPMCHEAHTVVYNDDDALVYDWWYNVTYKGWSEIKSGDGNFCPEGDETISLGECLLGENIAVDYRTIAPTTSISPSSSSSPTFCTGNTPDWVDGFGDGCDSYEENDDPGCEEYGEVFPAIDGSTAKESCCYCFLSNIPMSSPSITSSAPPTASKSLLVQSPPSTG